MWRSKKFIFIMVAAVLLVGGIAGVVFASDNGSGKLPPTQHDAVLNRTGNWTCEVYQNNTDALLNRTCEIYQNNTGVAIDPQELKAAFQQAQSEMMQTRLETRLQNLVNKGVITQEQADQFREWWQSKPADLISPFPALFRGGLRGIGGHFFMNATCPQK